MSFAQVIEGELVGSNRRRCECSVMEHLTASKIPVEAVAIDEDGCSFIIDSRDALRFANAVAGLNVAVKFHDRCARVALTRSSTDWPLPSLGRVMKAFDDEGIDLVHLTSEANALTVLVDESQADRVVGVFSRFSQPASRNVA
jgi:aspartokinase